jgi:hypothetical protein
MFAPVRDWRPSSAVRAELRKYDDEVTDFVPSFDDRPGAGSAALLESVDPAGLSDAALVDVMVGWGRLASWAQAEQSAVIAEFAKRRPPEWMDDSEATVNRLCDRGDCVRVVVDGAGCG